MKKANRAAQFMPFDSLKGLQEALREKERKHSSVTQKELSEEEQEELSQVLLKVEKGMDVRVVYFLDGHYVERKGILSSKNLTYKYITIDEEKILFSDLLKVIIN